ncbi:Nif3-like dinuclear metal center hexameric protein [Desulfonatronovibrio hydrogenovorans]|uniref:Nif3-like dinuclear metal center hexameric protein n=1 Tax=Desulfonatronovibrio hydrogenovorans TaxID=53245 RepID=UPI0004902752|nr:Nif3-like dinuclear metal center hexameric protein [Desulfonatronovibrio hydrogenovorans]
MELKRLIETIESFAPSQLALDWDRCGVQVAGTKQQIKSMAVALDPDEETIDQAVRLKVDFLLTHHPLTLKPKLPDKVDSFHRILSRLLSTNTILYSAHTSLDVNPAGPVSWLARDLGMQNTAVLFPTFTQKNTCLVLDSPVELPLEDIPHGRYIRHLQHTPQGLLKGLTLPCDQVEPFISSLEEKIGPFSFQILESSSPGKEYGLGLIGDLPGPALFADFMAGLQKILGMERIICAGQIPETVTRVAYCPGSGGDLAARAFSLGADIFITGDLKYHQAQEVFDQGCTLDPGHFILEEKMMLSWHEALFKRLSQVEIHFIRGKNPYRIFDKDILKSFSGED